MECATHDFSRQVCVNPFLGTGKTSTEGRFGRNKTRKTPETLASNLGALDHKLGHFCIGGSKGRSIEPRGSNGTQNASRSGAEAMAEGNTPGEAETLAMDFDMMTRMQWAGELRNEEEIQEWKRWNDKDREAPPGRQLA